jgi:sarcosine oxidase subunit alpha
MTDRLTFLFEGRAIEGRPGQSLAGALHAAGIRTLSWSGKYRRPRGLRCGTGVCPGCVLAVDGLGGVQACMTPARGGEDVRRIRPWLAWLPVDPLGRFAPAGFHGSRWLHSPRVWNLIERVLARLAGQAPIPRPENVPVQAGAAGFELRAVDLLIIGAGETGLTAAIGGARAGRSILLVDRDDTPGGRLLGELGGRDAADRLAAAARTAGVEILLSATALGSFDDGVQGIVHAGRLLAVAAGETRNATGSLDREVALPDGDRPGVMLASAVRRLVVREGVRPGFRAVIVETGPLDEDLVTLLAGAGTEVVARCAPSDVRAIHGRGAVRGITIGSLRIPCDLVVIAAGRRPADELARQTDVPEEPRVAAWT